MGRSRPRRPASPGLQEFLRDYTSGLSSAEIKRLWSEDAARAYEVLTRDRRDEADAQDRKGTAKRWLGRARLLFLGLSARLTPARRALFGVSIVSALLGLARIQWTVAGGTHGTRISVDTSAFLFAIAYGALLFLFAIELVDRVLVRDELQVARQLQRDLLPKAAPNLPGWSFAHAWRTANEVGGDYYSFLTLADGRLAIAIGDASGHGMAAGLLMAIANATLQTAVEVDPEPLRATELLHRLLLRTGDRRAFMSLFYGVLEPSTGAFDYVCAGHPFPLLRRRDGHIEELGTGALPLGMTARTNHVPGHTVVAPGDSLVMFTDGLPEALPGAGGEAFGFERLQRLVAPGGSAESIHARIWSEFRGHAGEAELRDDVTLVVISRAEAPGPPPPPPPTT